MAKEVVEKTITKTVTKQMPIENQSFIKKSSQVKKSFPKKKIAPSPRIVRHTSGLANASTIDKALIENFVGHFLEKNR